MYANNGLIMFSSNLFKLELSVAALGKAACNIDHLSPGEFSNCVQGFMVSENLVPCHTGSVIINLNTWYHMYLKIF